MKTQALPFDKSTPIKPRFLDTEVTDNIIEKIKINLNINNETIPCTIFVMNISDTSEEGYGMKRRREAKDGLDIAMLDQPAARQDEEALTTDENNCVIWFYYFSEPTEAATNNLNDYP
jgi:hypothetical protein